MRLAVQFADCQPCALSSVQKYGELHILTTKNSTQNRHKSESQNVYLQKISPCKLTKTCSNVCSSNLDNSRVYDDLTSRRDLSPVARDIEDVVTRDDMFEFLARSRGGERLIVPNLRTGREHRPTATTSNNKMTIYPQCGKRSAKGGKKRKRDSEVELMPHWKLADFVAR